MATKGKHGRSETVLGDAAVKVEETGDAAATAGDGAVKKKDKKKKKKGVAEKEKTGGTESTLEEDTAVENREVGLVMLFAKVW